MRSKNNELLNQIEARLMQAQSMIEVALNNHNYKCAGYDEPFIEHHQAGNLLWASSDLISLALDELGNMDLGGGKK
ncbi:hypothetical protein DES39_1886 [Orbus hercynius]|uniref:Phage protein n=1 Tax=Orbus hercynius TaxID=593135 RepID=A0A495RBW8_9GAMM|nr:hypothetical protein [Orbus hercynius]RKS84674.1 hypothetical protein DES39_1886 [Orbus hercynius]